MDVCDGCRAPLQSSNPAFKMERQTYYTTTVGNELPDVHGVGVVIRLCLPCAFANIAKIEDAIRRVLADGNRYRW